jgi:hypothetical protein
MLDEILLDQVAQFPTCSEAYLAALEQLGRQGGRGCPTALRVASTGACEAAFSVAWTGTTASPGCGVLDRSWRSGG